MRRLPHLSADRAKFAMDAYKQKASLSLPPETFKQNMISFFVTFFELSEKQAFDVLESLPGMSKGIEDFTDEEELGLLERLEGPLTSLSERNPWRWVKPQWDESDLELWDRLTHPDHDENGYKWKMPVPGPSIPNLLYNSKRILDGLPCPNKWDDYGNETGLVLGQVQSGKTASMLGVSSLALDQQIGYKILIVLGGHTENLRLQTLGRFEVFEKILKTDVYFGVRSDSDLKDLEKNSRRKELEDQVKVCEAALTHGKGRPVIFVIKKNPHALRGITAIMKKLHENGSKYPTLILDDESDHSSLNTKRNKEKASTIHRLICELRDEITQNAYLGYTATPQGVLLSNPKSKLFPENLLWLLEAHDKYVGPDDFFNGMSSMLLCKIPPDEFPNYGDPATEAELEKEDSPKLSEWQLSVFRDWREQGPPSSMYSAIFDFILTGAIRWWREDFDPEPNYPDHSLMFHVNRLKTAQSVIGDVVEDAWGVCSKAILNLMSRNYEYDFNNDRDMQIRNRWERIDNNIQMIRYDPKDRPEIHHLDDYIKLIISQVSAENKDHIKDGIRVVNSDEGSELPYHLEDGKGRPPRALILIGGDLLSRGLTIEGLCVSYYLRLAKKPAIDTELQRCRWFGAKKEYEDMLTLHIQPAHQKFFKDLADHNKDLMNQAKETILRGYTPKQSIFMLMARDSYQVTGYSKRGKFTTKLEDSYSGNGVQFKQPSVRNSSNNIEILDQFLGDLRTPNSLIAGSRGKLWTNVDFESLTKLLESIQYDDRAPSQIRPDELARYLRKWKSQSTSKNPFPSINIVQRFGDGNTPISQKRRDMDGSDGMWNIRASFTNLAAGAAGNFSGDWFIDAMSQKKGKVDMDKEKYETWFKDIPNSKQEKWQRRRSRKRVSGAPILFVFYKLDQNYVLNKRKDGKPGKWYLDPVKDSDLISENPLVGFIASLPVGGPVGNGIANSLLMDDSEVRMIAGREL